ncbi:Rho termination factor N-terminal domain-containing protein, partial [Arthrobacter sp. GCM10027362]|uniref:Rho termination factor N-terminal domain-containing protein n=1 Tax=Arthrobacter sp. GCM10027362 TaxID=3273379 RepID=UPI0036419159
MTETTDLIAGVEEKSDSAPKSAGLAGLKLVQLQVLAGQLGITGGSRMRKSDLVAAISDHQRGSAVADRPVRRTTKAAQSEQAPSEQAEKAPAGRAKLNEAPAEAAAAPKKDGGDPVKAAERVSRTRSRNRRASSEGTVAPAAGEGTAPVAAEERQAEAAAP